MSGMNAVTKLKSQGIDAAQDSQPKVSVFDIMIPTDGPLAHPRANDPVDEELLTNANGTGIMDVGRVSRPVLIWRNGVVNGKLQLVLIAGSRRTKGLIEAVRRWKERGEFRDGMHRIDVKYFIGDEKAAWKARLLENSDPEKKPDSAKVLAMSAIAMRKVQMTDDEILAVMPRIVRTKADLEALLRWDDLTPEAAARFDAGAPLALLGTVLDAPREKQAETVQTLIAAGATTSNKAGRVVNQTARANGTKAARPLTPKQIRALTVGASKLGLDDKMIEELHGAMGIDEIVLASQADGFALLGKLITQEIKVDDLPAHLREMAQTVLAK